MQKERIPLGVFKYCSLELRAGRVKLSRRDQYTFHNVIEAGLRKLKIVPQQCTIGYELMCEMLFAQYKKFVAEQHRSIRYVYIPAEYDSEHKPHYAEERKYFSYGELMSRYKHVVNTKTMEVKFALELLAAPRKYIENWAPFCINEQDITFSFGHSVHLYTDVITRLNNKSSTIINNNNQLLADAPPPPMIQQQLVNAPPLAPPSPMNNNDNDDVGDDDNKNNAAADMVAAAAANNNNNDDAIDDDNMTVVTVLTAPTGRKNKRMFTDMEMATNLGDVDEETDRVSRLPIYSPRNLTNAHVCAYFFVAIQNLFAGLDSPAQGKRIIQAQVLFSRIIQHVHAHAHDIEVGETIPRNEVLFSLLVPSVYYRAMITTLLGDPYTSFRTLRFYADATQPSLQYLLEILYAGVESLDVFIGDSAVCVMTDDDKKYMDSVVARCLPKVIMNTAPVTFHTRYNSLRGLFKLAGLLPDSQINNNNNNNIISAK
jgi:hypothetical protein